MTRRPTDQDAAALTWGAKQAVRDAQAALALFDWLHSSLSPEQMTELGHCIGQFGMVVAATALARERGFEPPEIIFRAQPSDAGDL